MPGLPFPKWKIPEAGSCAQTGRNGSDAPTIKFGEALHVNILISENEAVLAYLRRSYQGDILLPPNQSTRDP